MLSAWSLIVELLGPRKGSRCFGSWTEGTCALVCPSLVHAKQLCDIVEALRGFAGNLAAGRQDPTDRVKDGAALFHVVRQHFGNGREACALIEQQHEKLLAYQHFEL